MQGSTTQNLGIAEIALKPVHWPFPVERVSEDTLQFRSDVLGLNISRRSGNLEWYDPATCRHIVTFDDECVRADDERAARIQAESRVEMAEACVCELEEELRRLRGG